MAVVLEFLSPMAWLAAALLVPLLVHLLTKQQVHRLPFPTLRFIPRAQSAALRARVLSDWPLLLVRLLIVAAAIAAVSAPVLVSEARREAWNQRVARVVVVAAPAGEQRTSSLEALIDEERRQSFHSIVASSPTLPDAIRKGVDWLSRQPPARREIVFVGDLRDGDLAPGDLVHVPAHVGVRFVPLGGPASPARFERRAVAEGEAGNGLRAYRVAIAAGSDGTEARYEPDDGGVMPRLTVSAAADDQPVAEALVRAALEEGVSIEHDATSEVTLAFAGAPALSTPLDAPPDEMRHVLAQLPPGGRVGAHDGRVVVVLPVRAADDQAPIMVRRTLRALLTNNEMLKEPRRVPAATLAAWARPPGDVPALTTLHDEGDGRWFWAAALALMGLESGIRWRRRQRQGTSGSRPDTTADGVARVA